MSNINQEYSISKIENNKEKIIIKYTSEDIDKKIKEKPLAIYINDNKKELNNNIVFKVEHIDKPNNMLYLANLINSFSINNNITCRDFIAITPDRGTFYEIWDFLIENSIKYIYQNKINIFEISNDILNQIETFLKGFKANYDIRKVFDDVALNMYPKSREEINFVYDILDLNKISYVDDYMPSDIDSSNVSLWMFSTSKEEKEKISELLKKEDKQRIARLEELGAPEIILQAQKEPLECNYGVIIHKKAQKQIENILQSLKFDYCILDCNNEVIKEYKLSNDINE